MGQLDELPFSLGEERTGGMMAWEEDSSHMQHNKDNITDWQSSIPSVLNPNSNHDILN